MGLRLEVDRGVFLMSAVPYDEAIVDWIRTLPDRRYRRARRDWSVPARREHLRAICELLAELDERSIDVEISETAQARLARADIGRAVLRKDAIEIVGPYSLRRLAALRALPERRYDPDRKTWTVPLTRAGALAILELADGTDELVTTQRARRALRRLATPIPAPRRVANGHLASGPTRRSPVAHWRHHTAGPVFENPARERVYVPGVGICVRVRVNPHRGRGD